MGLPCFMLYEHSLIMVNKKEAGDTGLERTTGLPLRRGESLTRIQGDDFADPGGSFVYRVEA